MSAGSLSLHLLLALVLVVSVTPLLMRWAPRWGFIDQPGLRKSHRQAMPRLGGVALVLGVVVPLLALGSGEAPGRLWAGLTAALLVALAGLWDDHRGLGVGGKLSAQALAALVLVEAGIRVDLGGPAWFEIALTLLWVVGVTNALNLIDNMDGVSSAVAAVAAAFFLALTLLSGAQLAAGLAAALLGATVGFLLYNRPPARIFMGDAGSFFLGILLAVLGIEITRHSTASRLPWLPAVLVLAVPIFDTLLVSISRLRRGKNPLTTPGQDHVSHRLRRLGWDDARIVLVLALIGVLSGALGWVAAVGPRVAAWIAAGIVLAVGIGALWWLERDEKKS